MAADDVVTCGLCREEFGMLEIGTHLIQMHPQIAHAIELWPDEGMVALDEELTPDMFLHTPG